MSSLFGDNPVEKMQKQLFNLRFTAKSLTRESKKCEKDEKDNKKNANKQWKKETWKVQEFTPRIQYVYTINL